MQQKQPLHKKRVALQALGISVWCQRTQPPLSTQAAATDAHPISASLFLLHTPPDAHPPGSCVPLFGRAELLFQAMLDAIQVNRQAVHILSAATASLDPRLSLPLVRGTLYHEQPQDIPLLITYHPAYLLTHRQAKAEVYRDLCQLQARLHDHYTGVKAGTT